MQSAWQLLISIIKKLHIERTRRIIAENELAQRNTQFIELAKQHQVLCNEKDKLKEQLAQETGAEK